MQLPLLLIASALLAADAPSDLNRVAVGTRPPAFELPSADGQKVSLATLAGKNVVLVFYRGYW
jgi:cytochrome oxidase Cu insertion factor (SCO1/SenC/PrrC family)